MSSEKQIVECFHLLFLSQLGSKIDKKVFVVKGGCNLRFFFKSIRYSEDLDLDVQTMAKDTLRKNINQIFQSQSFKQILQSQELEIMSVSEPKQTETTQRWKLRVRSRRGLDVPTKIECSRRGIQENVSFDLIDPTIIQKYNLRSIPLNHYSKEVAFAQKVEALIQRAQTQARDIFDLKLLLDAGAKSEALPKNIKSHLGDACQNLLSIGFDEFNGQVVAFLEPEFQEFYGTTKAWNSIQGAVLNVFEEASL